MGKPVILSGIQPSGALTLGNYIGAIRNWVELQKDHDCLFMLVDLLQFHPVADGADVVAQRQCAGRLDAAEDDWLAHQNIPRSGNPNRPSTSDFA